MELLDSLSQSFARDGYVIIERAFDPKTIATIGREIDRVHGHFDELKEKEPQLYRIGEWSVREPHLVSEEIRHFIFSEPFKVLCRQILDNDLSLFWAMTAAKPPSRGKSFDWHQDVGLSKDLPQFITCWSAIDRVEVENGGLYVIPESHRLQRFAHRFFKLNETTYAGVFIDDQDFEKHGAIALHLNPGDIVVLHPRLIHSSGPNLSKRKRRALISAYVRPWSEQFRHLEG
jgi:ectoine hydroxylase-related dioxygenase (phytanoyl-CoA dioxygenase family)